MLVESILKDVLRPLGVLSSLTVFLLSDWVRRNGHLWLSATSPYQQLYNFQPSNVSGLLLLTRLWASEQKSLPKTGHQFHKGVGNVQQPRDCFVKNVSVPPVSGTNTVTGVLLY